MSTETEGPARRGRIRGVLGKVVIDTRPLRIREYRRLWVSTVVTAVGSQLTAVAVPKQVYDLTGSSGYVGLTGAVGLVPLLVFGLWGGAIADALDRRKVMLYSNLGVAVTSGLLWLQAFASVRSVAVVLVLLGLQQAFVAVNMPARSAAVARVVPPELLPPANALSFTTFTFGMVFGPLLAGSLIPLLGLSTLYLIDTVALTIAFASVYFLPPIAPSAGSSRKAGLRDIADGFRYLSLKKLLLVSFLVDIIAMVAGMPRALFPEMAERTFGDPPGGGAALGWLYAAIPIGSALFGLFSGAFARIRRQGAVITVSIIGWGLAMTAFGLTGSLLLAVIFLAIGGGADLISAVHRSSMLQTEATDEMRGRMQGVFTVVVAGGPRIADLVHGWGAAATSTAVAATAGGVLVIVLTVATVAWLPSFWKFRFTPAPTPEPEAETTRS
ncbi:MFS transporter [Actinokineospora globicatena]|uniref:MFS transporter n=1 Tax=Actinokineospora globicatena TaxID=103729 RepID=UPI0020A445ED|nr:MFS transporter [Actinokineospora globicatena]MCP2300750.1 putative arabinose efflux permease, MFS family [Actinokineospora globicatena]GLW77625.1 MFS transporter [Actinokineospora globicatena]GLW84461.1 MFS transporter [Actinokineospora globicatena]